MKTDKIERITKEEFMAIRNRRNPGPLNTEIREVQVGDAFKTGCQWKHAEATNGCNGAAIARDIAKRMGKKLTCRCKDGTLYIMRIA